MTTELDPGTTEVEGDAQAAASLRTRVGLPPGSAGQHSIKLARSVHSGRIARALRESIVDGALPAGTPLIESRLASQLGVSRGPVRSALHVLQGEGLVETLPNGRMVTVSFGPDDLRDLLAVRHELESSAVRRGAAARADIAPIRAAFDAIRSEGATTGHLVELDVEFHRSLVAFGGSRFLTSAWLALAPVIQAVISIGNRRLAREDPASNYHRILAAHERVLEPLARYDADAVSEVLAAQFAITLGQFRPEDA